MCVEYCQHCQKGPICNECIVEHSLNCRQDELQKLNQKIEEVKGHAQASSDQIVSALKAEAREFKHEEVDQITRMRTEGRRLEHQVHANKDQENNIRVEALREIEALKESQRQLEARGYETRIRS